MVGPAEFSAERPVPARLDGDFFPSGAPGTGLASLRPACHDRHMAQILLLTVGALVVGAIGFGVAALISGSDPGLAPVEPDSTAIALPSSRPLWSPTWA